MPIQIIRQNITRINCDAIVNPTDPYFSHGGGTDAAIHDAAGIELERACAKLGVLSVGNAVITPAFALPCKYVIHTVGPIWSGGEKGEEVLLRSCYQKSLDLAKANECETVAFPLISSGRFGFPRDKVMRIAMDVISAFLYEYEMTVYIVVFDKYSYSISAKLFDNIRSFINDNYDSDSYRLLSQRTVDLSDKSIPITKAAVNSKHKESDDYPPCCSMSLEDMLRSMDKGFADTLFEYIDAKGITDVECYKRANIDKKTFSKIKCNKNYKPSKVTAVSFAIALRLDIDQTARLLKTVGFSLSRSNKFDIIIEYFITTGNYKDIFDVNETLYQFDQAGLGI